MKDLIKELSEKIANEFIRETLGEVKKNEQICNSRTTEFSNAVGWEIGKRYAIRTVTMIYVGVLLDYNDKELILSNCAWIPETSRWNEFLKGCSPREMEPYPTDKEVLIGRGALADACQIDGNMIIQLI